MVVPYCEAYVNYSKLDPKLAIKIYFKESGPWKVNVCCNFNLEKEEKDYLASKGSDQYWNIMGYKRGLKISSYKELVELANKDFISRIEEASF